MRIIRTIGQMKNEHKPVCLAAGFFDGVHTGHQEVLRRAVCCAQAHGGHAWVMTFDTHPLKVLRPDAAPPLLTSTPHKLALIDRLGLHGCLLIPFTRRLAGMAPEAFLNTLHAGMPTLREIFVGTDWRFGHRGAGDTALLEQWAARHDLQVTKVPPVRWRGQPVSSTRIRQAIAAGKLADAAVMLGRPFSLLGTVQPGRRVGRQLGYPTANLAAHNEVRPPLGVYAVRAIRRNRTYAGILNFGVHPTLDAAPAPLFELLPDCVDCVCDALRCVVLRDVFELLCESIP